MHKKLLIVLRFVKYLKAHVIRLHQGIHYQVAVYTMTGYIKYALLGAPN